MKRKTSGFGASEVLDCRVFQFIRSWDYRNSAVSS